MKLKYLLGLLALWTSLANAWPDKPVRLVVAFPPGSSTDVVARQVAIHLGAALGQPVVVENRPGASGNLATQFVAKQPADGHTLLMHSVAVAVNPSLYSSAGYNVQNDLEPVAMAAVSPNVVYVNPEVSALNLRELFELARKKKLAYASSGNGTTTHLGAEILFRQLANVDILHVPFAPAAAATAVVSGQVPIGSTSLPPVVQLAAAGKVRALAVTSRKRSAALPDVPTVEELGFKNFESNTWFAMFAPAGTPEAVINRLNAETNKVLLYKSVVESFRAQSLEIERMDRIALRAYIVSEESKWRKVIKDVNAKVD